MVTEREEILVDKVKIELSVSLHLQEIVNDGTIGDIALLLFQEGLDSLRVIVTSPVGFVRPILLEKIFELAVAHLENSPESMVDAAKIVNFRPKLGEHFNCLLRQISIYNLILMMEVASLEVLDAHLENLLDLAVK